MVLRVCRALRESCSCLRTIMRHPKQQPACYFRPAIPCSSSSSSPSPPNADPFARIRADAQQSYFHLFQLHPVYDIDQHLLKQRFTQLQKLFHPDKFASDNQASQEMSAEMSSLINSAFKALQDPHSRGLYLLRLQGQELREDDSSVQLSGDFLNDMMKLNEDVEDAAAANDVDYLIQMRKENVSKQLQLQQQIAQAFLQQDYDLCKRQLIQLKFYRSIEQSIKQKLP